MQEPTLTRSVTVARTGAGTSVTAYLAARFSYQNGDQWAEHAQTGRVTLNGRACPGNAPVAEGDIIAFTPDRYDEPPVNENFAVIAEDEDFLFVDKGAPLPCHPGGIYLDHTLWALLRKRGSYIAFVNRLDRETSGIVIVAKNREAAREANFMMSERKIGKEYLVLVEGDFPPELDAKGTLAPDLDSPVRKKLGFTMTDGEGIDEAGSVSCRTLFTLERKNADGTSLVKARPLTGRTHQIRATLRSLGWPVVGDKLYGLDDRIFLRFIEGSMTDGDRSALRIDRQALHCSRITLPRPDGRAYDIVSRLPDFARPPA